MSAQPLVEVFVSAGSNVEPVRHLRMTLAELRQRFGALRVSRAYRNAAVGFEGPEFINLVVGFRTGEPVRQVIATLREIGERCGRPRTAPQWAPRAMDLDILLYDALVCATPDLTLPRPDLLRRAYMLGPLAEIAGDLVHPQSGQTIGELWKGFDRGSHPLTPVELLD